MLNLAYNKTMALTYIRGIHDLLIRSGKTIAVAESCTGGLLSKMLTDYPGSSRYFLLGVVAYHHKAKEKILHIPFALIARHGAVSREIAEKMASQVRKIAGADLGVGVTGIAGPSGGTKAKPAGTVFIAAANAKKTICTRFVFKGTRAQVRIQSAEKAAYLLKNLLLSS
jgi:PncC family amidohydrolase